tara:strand:+ start:541 stop:900 length:360 start_codon:yes stop_codon:yes gene_type:complete
VGESPLKDRYDKTHQYKETKFYLSNYLPNQEECKIIILKIVEQASRDYLALHNAGSPALKYAWETAKDFIFTENYLIDWGGQDVTPRYLLDLVDINIEWLRRKMKERFIKLKKERENSG